MRSREELDKLLYTILDERNNTRRYDDRGAMYICASVILEVLIDIRTLLQKEDKTNKHWTVRMEE